jgi:hypothetical protein
MKRALRYRVAGGISGCLVYLMRVRRTEVRDRLGLCQSLSEAANLLARRHCR